MNEQKRLEIILGMCIVFSAIILGIYLVQWQFFNEVIYPLMIGFLLLIGIGIYCAIRLDKLQVKRDTKKSNQ